MGSMIKKRNDSSSLLGALVSGVIALAITPCVCAQPGTVSAYQKISDTEGGFTGTLDDRDRFGKSVAQLTDIDGNGVVDLAVGAWGDDDGGNEAGAIWLLFLNRNGTVRGHQKISAFEGGFTGSLDKWDIFGTAVTSIGDLNGDGRSDIAVGAPGDDDGGSTRGAVWVLFLEADGRVGSHQKISDTQGGFEGKLVDYAEFGASVVSMGDLNGDGIIELAIGSPHDADGGYQTGAVWVLSVNQDGTVRSHQKISDLAGNFGGELHDQDFFGFGVAAIGDLDQDGVSDLVVGAPGDDDGGFRHGAIWIMFLNSDGTVKQHQKISDTQGGFMGELEYNEWFGASVASCGDLNGDGISDIAVGAPGRGSRSHGAVWILFLNASGTVQSHVLISDAEGGFEGTLDPDGGLGWSVAAITNMNGNGATVLAAGATEDSDGESARGAAWLFFVESVPSCIFDLDGDGIVGAADLLSLLVVWGTDPGGPPDFDGDGTVGASDLLTLLVNWGPCP